VPCPCCGKVPVVCDRCPRRIFRLPHPSRKWAG